MKRHDAADAALDKQIADLQDIAHRAHGDTPSAECVVCLKQQLRELAEAIRLYDAAYVNEHGRQERHRWERILRLATEALTGPSTQRG